MPRDVAVSREPDPWASLRPATPARIGLRRAGDALALEHVLDLQLCHSRARDAVHVPMDAAAIATALTPRESIQVRSKAPDRSAYLRRPDLGRRLDDDCLSRLPKGPFDAVFVIGDGLSSAATGQHAIPLLNVVLARLRGWNLAPILVATQARVALADDIGAAMSATLSIMLIGERPGLSACDSLGIYVTYAPRPGRRDSERNCISNIHGAGLSYAEAADQLCWLLSEARARKVSGVMLKEDRLIATR